MNQLRILGAALAIVALSGCHKHHAKTIIEDDIAFTIDKTAAGVTLDDFSKDGTHFLKSDKNPPLFEATVGDVRSGTSIDIDAQSGWGEVSISRSKDQTVIKLAQPENSALPSTLAASIFIVNEGDALSWDLEIEGLGGNHSVLDVKFPQVALKATGDDHYFIPYRFGKIIDNPGQVNLDYGTNGSGAHFPDDPNPLMPDAGQYPKGWGATMQYMAYYNNSYGLYVGFHDPKANLKILTAKSANNSIVVGSTIPAPGRTRVGNDFDYPGVVELRPYTGDWYDAAQIYKDWVYHNADYRPPEQLTARARKLGEISVWGTQSIYDDVTNHGSTSVSLKENIDGFYNFIQSRNRGNGIIAGMHWTGAHGGINEHNMPQFYPSDITRELVAHANAKGMETMVYTNGYLYDLNIDHPDNTVPDFSAVEDYAARNEAGDLYTQSWKGKHYARMCPTQSGWVNILKNVHQSHLAPLRTTGVFIDQVTAASPVPCSNPNHGHPLGGGHYWRDGLKSLIETIRSVYPEDTFVVTEAVNDSLMDVVNGYETASRNYLIENQVPAIQVVYGGKVQFIGPAVGTGNYSNAQGLSAYALALGATPGYFYPHFRDSDVAKQIALRSQLKEYISFGEMMRPPKPKGDIPDITISRGNPDNSNYRAATISAIQAGAWKSRQDDSVALLFVNGQKQNGTSLSFAVDVLSTDYGLQGVLSLTKLTAENEETLGTVKGSFSIDANVPAGEAVAYILTELDE